MKAVPKKINWIKMKTLIKKACLGGIATVAILVSTQVSVFAATTTTNQSNDMSAASVVASVAVLILAIVLPAFKSETNPSIQK